MKNSCTVRNSRAPKPTTSQIWPTCWMKVARSAYGGKIPNSVGLAHSNAGDSAQIEQQHNLAPQVVADLDVLLVLVGGVVDFIVALGLKEEVASLTADHRYQPADERRGSRVFEDQSVCEQKTERAQQVE